MQGNDAEHLLLGCILSDPTVFPDLPVTEEDFIGSNTRALFKAIDGLYHAGSDIDAATVYNAIKNQQSVDAGWIASLTEQPTASPSFAFTHADKVAGNGFKHELDSVHKDSSIVDSEDTLARLEGLVQKEKLRKKYQSGAITGPESCSPVEKWIYTPALPQEWIINFFIPTCSVGLLIATGGVGKSNLAQLLCLVVALGPAIEAPFRASQKRRVLLINVEDPEVEIHRRFHELFKHYPVKDEFLNTLSENLLVYAGRGKIGPLMKYDSGNPIVTEYYHWLSNSIKNTRPELVVLDTKSRLYGLDENSPDDNTQWLRHLEALSEKYKCSFLVIHHQSKDGAKKGGSDIHSSRGGSSLTDNSRFGFVASNLCEKEAKSLGLSNDDAKEIFKLVLPKGNYGPKQPTLYFKRGEAGIPLQYSPYGDRRERVTEILIEYMDCNKDMNGLTWREMRNTPKGKSLRDFMAEEFGSWSKVEQAVFSALRDSAEKGLIKIETVNLRTKIREEYWLVESVKP